MTHRAGARARADAIAAPTTRNAGRRSSAEAGPGEGKRRPQGGGASPSSRSAARVTAGRDRDKAAATERGKNGRRARRAGSRPGTPARPAPAAASGQTQGRVSSQARVSRRGRVSRRARGQPQARASRQGDRVSRDKGTPSPGATRNLQPESQPNRGGGGGGGCGRRRWQPRARGDQQPRTTGNRDRARLQCPHPTLNAFTFGVRRVGVSFGSRTSSAREGTVMSKEALHYAPRSRSSATIERRAERDALAAPGPDACSARRWNRLKSGQRAAFDSRSARHGSNRPSS